jgi:hypothetical protein
LKTRIKKLASIFRTKKQSISLSQLKIKQLTLFEKSMEILLIFCANLVKKTPGFRNLISFLFKKVPGLRRLVIAMVKRTPFYHTIRSLYFQLLSTSQKKKKQKQIWLVAFLATHPRLSRVSTYLLQRIGLYNITQKLYFRLFTRPTKAPLPLDASDKIILLNAAAQKNFNKIKMKVELEKRRKL